MQANHDIDVPRTSSTSESRPAQRPLGLIACLILLITGVVACGVYGVVQLQRSVDRMYSIKPDPAAILATASNRTIIGNPMHGRESFNMSCYVCHGPNGAGVPGLGPTLRLRLRCFCTGS